MTAPTPLIPGEAIAMPGMLRLDSWAGRSSHPVMVIRSTSRRSLIRFTRDMPFGLGARGSEKWVPRAAVASPTFRDLYLYAKEFAP